MRLEGFLKRSAIPFRLNVSLADLTTFKIGGLARLLVEPTSVEELAAFVRACDAPPRVLGSGANVLVRDVGVDAVVSLRRMNRLTIEGERVEVGAGYSFPRLVMRTVMMGLGGLEGLVGIPASVGGAIFMNAGGRHGETFDALEAVDVLNGGPARLAANAIAHAYRNGGLEGKIVTGGVFGLRQGDPEELRHKMSAAALQKHATQPLRLPSAGCVFKNPKPESAGNLIERAGLKGRRVGGAQVSEVHANFIVNSGGASSDDVLKLVDIVRDGVSREFRRELELEVKVW